MSKEQSRYTKHIQHLGYSRIFSISKEELDGRFNALFAVKVST